MSMRLLTSLLALICLATSPTGQEPDGPGEIQPAELGATRNVHRDGDLWFGGQFTPEDIAVLQREGIRRVITLRTEGEIEWDEGAVLEAAGIAFVELPFRAPDTLTDEIFTELRALLKSDAGPTLFHCGSANRVGGAWIPYRVLDEGVALEQAVQEARTIGLRTPGYEERALAYIEKHRGEQSVKPGINKGFKNPELDVESYIQRFEVESREVYSAQGEVLAALGVEAGMRVADVGAGTGLYTLPLAQAVGSGGWIFAVDIAPRFLTHIRGRAAEAGTANLSTVLCSEKSIGLAPASVDLVYVCDTYHHFEYPASTLASIHSALKPGGRLVVIDFERIPGVTREWLLDHVRAGKDVFRSEIEQAGFELVREHDIEGLEENYMLEFRRLDAPKDE